MFFWVVPVVPLFSLLLILILNITFQYDDVSRSTGCCGGGSKVERGSKFWVKAPKKSRCFCSFLAALIALLRFKKREGHDVYDLYVDFDFDVPLPT